MSRRLTMLPQATAALIAFLLLLSPRVTWGQDGPPSILPPQGRTPPADFIAPLTEVTPSLDSPAKPDQYAPNPRQAKQAIQRALNGEEVGSQPNGVLEDVLGVLQKRKSVLKGSELDPKKKSGPPHQYDRRGRAERTDSFRHDGSHELEHARRAVRSHHSHHGDRSWQHSSPHPIPPHPVDPRYQFLRSHSPSGPGAHPSTHSNAPHPHESAFAAEQLLKAARLLSETPGFQQDPLVEMLRKKAVQLLSR